MNCQDFRMLMDDALDGELAIDRLQAWHDHRAGCEACRRCAAARAEANQAIAGAVRGHVEGLPASAAGRAAVLERLAARSRRWWLGPAAAALIMLGVASAFLVAERAGQRPADRDAAGTIARSDGRMLSLAELRDLAAWQDGVARDVAAGTGDPLWRLVACSYLPPGRIPSVSVPATAMPVDAERRTVVSWQRTSRRGDRVTTVDFQQFDDGTVHVEHQVAAPDGETVTRLDAASWERLVESHGTMCRELGLVGEDAPVGLPLPSRGGVERDARLAWQAARPPVGLARRLLVLRLAPDVSGRDDLDAAVHRVLGAATTTGTDTGTDQSPSSPDEVVRLMTVTGADRLPPDEWRNAMRCLTALRQPMAVGR